MSVYRWAMRKAAPILFWLSIVIVLISIFRLYDSLDEAERSLGVGFEGLRSFVRFKLLISAFGQSLLSGSLPFAAAVLINRIDRFLELREAPRA